jgi:hypothetical protein
MVMLGLASCAPGGDLMASLSVALEMVRNFGLAVAAFVGISLRESAGKYEGDEPPIDMREIMKTLRDHLVLK